MKEQEESKKLTPASRKGYDGSRPIMSEHKDFDPSEEHREKPEKHHDPGGQSEHDEEESDKETKNRSTFAEIVAALSSVVRSNNSTAESEILGTVAETVAKAAKANKDPEEALAKGLAFLVPEPTTPDSTDEELTRADTTTALFHTILEKAEDIGMDEKKVLKHLADISDKQQDTVPESYEDRAQAFEDYMRHVIANASDEAIVSMQDDWKSLQGAVAKDTQISEDTYDKVIEAETLLAELVEQKEDKAHQEFTDLDEQAMTLEFTEMIRRVFDAKAKFDLQKEAEEILVLEDEKKAAAHMMNILLAPDSPNDVKQKMIAAMLAEQYPIQGDETVDNLAVRKEIFRMAALADLDTNAIEIDEVFDETHFEKVNELKSVPVENSFEALVAQQIEDASIADLEKIRAAWEELKKDNATNSELLADADEAISVLGDIINFRTEQQKAHARGERVDPKKVAKPRQLENDAEEEQHNTSEAQSDEATREKLVAQLLKMLLAADPTNEVDKELIHKLTGLLIITEKNYDEQVAKITALISSLPGENKRRKDAIARRNMIAEIQTAAMAHGIFDVIPKEDQGTDPEKEARLVELFKESLKDDITPIRDLQKELKALLEHDALRKEMKPHVQEVTEAVEQVLTSKKKQEKREAASHEKPFTLVLETHDDDENTDNKLLAWRDTLLAKLRDNPEGKILVLLEDGTITKAESEAITNFVSEEPPRVSILDVLPGDAVSSRYIRTRNKILDELHKKYPGRLHVLTEWKLEDYEGEYIPDLSAIKTTDDLSESAIAALQEQIKAFVELKEKRDAVMTDATAKALQLEGIVGGVGLVGTAHNPVGHQLEKLGYDVEQVFGDKNGDETFINPFAAYVRTFSMFPNKQPDDKELRLVLRAEMRLESLRSSNANEKEIRKDIYKWMREERKKPEYHQADAGSGSSVEQKEVQLVGALKALAVGTPVPIKQPDSLGRKLVIENEDIEPTASQLQQTAHSITDWINNQEQPPLEHERQLFEQVGAIAGGNDRAREIYSREASVQQLEDQLHDLIKKAQEQNTSEGVVQLRNIPRLLELHQSLVRQRNQLAKLKGYEGYIQTKSEMDPELYGENVTVDESLEERMNRIREGLLTPGKYTEKEILKYYTELQRWTNILLDNDIRRNPQNVSKKDALRLSNQRFGRYLEISKRSFQAIDAETRAAILDDIGYMVNQDKSTGGNFLRYFMQNAPDPKNIGSLLGVPYNRPDEMGNYQPESLHATMNEIANKYGVDFQTGGKNELINAEGEFQYHNFIYWIRKKINEDVDYNKDGGINPYGKITIKLDMGSISMYELLLLIPEYTAQRKFEIRMQNGNEDEVYSGWGDKVEDPSFTWAELDLIAMEMEFRQMTHELRVQFRPTSNSGDRKQYLEMMKKMHHNNHWTRAANIFLLLGYPSGTVENAKQEFDDWKDPNVEAQGSLGKAMSDMIVAYNYLSELTDYIYKPGTKDQVKNFNENMFYRFLEPDGANRFLTKMSEGALNNHLEAKAKYAEFINERMSAVAETYKRKADAEGRKTIEQLQMEYMSDPKDKTINISFTESDKLTKFCTLVEKTVLKSTKTPEELEADIARTIQNELVTHLKKGYFSKLLDMKVARIAEWEEGRKKKEKGDRESSYRFFMVDKDNPEIRFGDIKIKDDDGDSYTMQQLLESFDVDQINKFDYKSNDPNDPNNPFRNLLNPDKKDELRRSIDWFMDPNKNPGNHKLFKQNEKMMLAFTKHIARINRKNINHFRDANENELTQNMVRDAMKHVMEKAYGINGEESTYAWWWVRDYIYLWGIGASLDVDGIGFRWDGKIMNPGRWRPRRQGKDGGGNPHTFDEFLTMSMPFLHHMQVVNHTDPESAHLGHRSVFSWLQGGEGGKITPRAVRSFDRRSNYNFEQNAEALYVDNTLDNSSELIDLLAKTEFDVTQIISFDQLGNVVYDYGKAREVFGKWRKACRYAYGKNSLDYREKIWANGREKTLYEHFFGPKTRALNDIIYNETERTEDFKFKDPADAVLMSIIAAEIAEHRQMFSAGHHWTIQDVLELERFLLDFMTEYKDDGDNIDTKYVPNKGTLFNHNIFKASLNAYHTAYFKMYAVELNASFWGGLFKGIGEGVEDFFKGKWIW